ncbi:MAG: cytochrome c biogenesis CcdA family protein [Armatimonadota bacterium]
MSDSVSISITAAFIAGVLSFLSPCVLPLVPAYLSYISGASIEELKTTRSKSVIWRTGLRSITFVLGFSVIFVLIGAGATWLGQVLAEKLDILTKIAGIVIFIFGLHTIGVFRIKALFTERRFHILPKNAGFLGAFLIGMMFALGWTPCIGPVLSGIIALAANSGTVHQGILLLVLYSLGLGIPFIIAGFAASTIMNYLSVIKKHFRIVEITSGVILLIIGVMIFMGSFQRLSDMASQFFNR